MHVRLSHAHARGKRMRRVGAAGPLVFHSAPTAPHPLYRYACCPTTQPGPPLISYLPCATVDLWVCVSPFPGTGPRRSHHNPVRALRLRLRQRLLLGHLQAAEAHRSEWSRTACFPPGAHCGTAHTRYPDHTGYDFTASAVANTTASPSSTSPSRLKTQYRNSTTHLQLPDHVLLHI